MKTEKFCVQSQAQSIEIECFDQLGAGQGAPRTADAAEVDPRLQEAPRAVRGKTTTPA